MDICEHVRYMRYFWSERRKWNEMKIYIYITILANIILSFVSHCNKFDIIIATYILCVWISLRIGMPMKMLTIIISLVLNEWMKKKKKHPKNIFWIIFSQIILSNIETIYFFSDDVCFERVQPDFGITIITVLFVVIFISNKHA